jgi:hypothetical protein
LPNAGQKPDIDVVKGLAKTEFFGRGAQFGYACHFRFQLIKHYVGASVWQGMKPVLF